MSKQYKVNLNIDVSKYPPTSGFSARQVPKEANPEKPDMEFDPKGYKDRTGPEVFAYLCGAAINGASKACGFQALKGFRQIIRSLNTAAEKDTWIANKSDIDTVKHSINGNQNWPNADDVFDVLESIMNNLEKAELFVLPQPEPAAK